MSTDKTLQEHEETILSRTIDDVGQHEGRDGLESILRDGPTEATMEAARQFLGHLDDEEIHKGLVRVARERLES